MPKSANVLPNIRVDIPDYEAQTALFSGDLMKQWLERFVIDNWSTIAEGFRVEIADQGISPGLFTIYNGNAIDRDGQIVNNEEDIVAQRSETLPADATYYVEVEFTSGASDTGARGFWDPSYENGTDPSGDARAAGREFQQNVATRYTPDWQIVTPIATSGFAVTTDPDTTKIPVAVITRAAGIISGGTSDPLRSVTAEDYLAAVTSIQLLDTRAMLDAFTLKLDPGLGVEEDVTVTANDRENGILTLSAGTVNAHDRGARAVVAGVGPAEFLIERIASPIPSSGTEDARPRMFQADEERGRILGLDPSGTGDDRSDVSVTSLKRHVDFLAAQIRELKWGSPLNSEVGDVAPPSSFASEPHYYDHVGGLAGARTCTLSVGDGVSTFGDFNTTQSGSAVAAIQAAIDALPATGGTVYIKAGTYDIGATPIALNKPGVFVGDGPDATIIRATDAGGAEAVTVLVGDRLSVEGIAFKVNTGGGATATASIDLGLGAGVFRRCIIQGLDSTAAEHVVFDMCEFMETSNGGGAVTGDFSNCIFRKCSFFSGVSGSSSRHLVFTGSVSNVALEDCNFTLISGQGVSMELGSSASQIKLERCLITGAGGGWSLKFLSATESSHVSLLNSRFTNEGGIGQFIDCDQVRISGCFIQADEDAEGVNFSTSGTGSSSGLFLDNTEFTHSGSTAASSGVALRFHDGSAADGIRDAHVSNCTFLHFATGVKFSGTYFQNFVFTGCTFGRNGIDTGFETTIRGIWAELTVTCNRLRISDCEFSRFNDDGFTGNAGAVYLQGTVDGLLISNCAITTVGSSTWTEAYAIYLANVRDSRISGVIVSGVDSGTAGTDITMGIFVHDADQLTISDCTIEYVGDGSHVGQWFGIRVEEPTHVTVANNHLNEMGNAASTFTDVPQDEPAGISLGSSADFAGSHCSIHGNTIQGLAHGANYHRAIAIGGGMQYLTITGNAIKIDEDNLIGIHLVSVGGGSNILANISITGNTIIGAMDTGIWLSPNIASTERNFTISGNTLNDFINRGIHVTHGLGAPTYIQNVSIVGNSLYTDSNSGVTAISVWECIGFCVNSNAIQLASSSGISEGIVFDTDGINGTVCGNSVGQGNTGTTGEGIDMVGVYGTMVAGNYVEVTKNAATDGGLDLGDTGFAAANHIRNNDPSGYAIRNAGSSTYTDAGKNSDQTTHQVPASLSDVGLNRRRS
jgi:hypothetical protein